MSFIAKHILLPTYYEVGKKLLPEANWINASIFNYKEFGHFKQCISTPVWKNQNRP